MKMTEKEDSAKKEKKFFETVYVKTWKHGKRGNEKDKKETKKKWWFLKPIQLEIQGQ